MGSPKDTLLDTVTAPTVACDDNDRTSIDAPRTHSGSVFPPHVPWAAGSVLNERYDLESLLGSGGMGVVFRAYDQIRREHVAVKILAGAKPRNIDRFKSEFDSMTRLQHPNVAAVYDFERIEGTPNFLFTMELIDGCNIATFARKHDFETLLDLTVSACRALSYLHSRDLVHFDIKPSNIMVTHQGVLKLVDFGICGPALRDTQSEISGTAAYMAPEALRSSPKVDLRVDLFSLGVTLYTLVCGLSPSKARSISHRGVVTLLDFHESEWNDIPTWFKNVIRDLTAEDPDQRIATANAVIHAINQRGNRDFAHDTYDTRQSYVFASRFVGRKQELELVESHLASRLSGKPSPPALMIRGTSGIGKSRLVREIRHRLQLDNVWCVAASCYERSASELLPIVTLLEQLTKRAKATGNQDLLSTYASTLARLEASTFVESLEIDAVGAMGTERFALLEQLARFMAQLAQRRAYVISLSDLQWARQATLDVIAQLLRLVVHRQKAGQPVPLAVLCDYRSDEVGLGLNTLLTELNNTPHVTTLEVTALGKTEVRGLLGSMLGTAEPPRELVTAITRQAQGNPFFVEELLRTLVEQDSVHCHRGEWKLVDNTATLALPTSIRLALARRVDALPPHWRQLLEVLAVFDRPMPQSLVEDIVDFPELRPTLAVLRERGMIVTVDPTNRSHQVAHDQIRAALYDQVPLQQRRQLHARIAEAIERQYPESLGAWLYDLAQHFDRAHLFDKAYVYSRQAADRAAREFAHDVGIENYERALRLAPPTLQQQDRLQLRETLAGLKALKGDLQDARTELTSILEAVDNDLVRSRVLSKLAEVCSAMNSLDAAANYGWQSVRVLGGRVYKHRAAVLPALAAGLLKHEGKKAIPVLFARTDRRRQEQLTGLSQCYLQLAYSYFFTDPLRAVLCILRARDAADAANARRSRLEVAGLLSTIMRTMNKWSDSDRLSQQAIELASRGDSPWERGVAGNFRGMHLFAAGSWRDAEKRFIEAKRELLRSGDLFQVGIAFIHLSWVNFLDGRFTDALQQSVDGLSLLERGRAMQLGKSLFVHRALNMVKRYGLSDTALELFDKAILLSRQANDPMHLSASYMFRADVLLLCGRTQQAYADALEAVTIRERDQVKTGYHYWAYALLAYCCVDRIRTDSGSRSELLATCRRAVKKITHLTHKNHPTFRVPALIAKGRYELLVDPSRAVVTLHEAEALAKRQHMKLWLLDLYLYAGRDLCAEHNAPTRLGNRYLEQCLALAAETQADAYHSAAQTALDAFVTTK